MATTKKTSFTNRLVGRIVFWAVAIFFIWWLVAFVLQRRFLFPADAAVQDPGAKSRIRNLREVWIDTPDGKVEGWFLPGNGLSRDRPGPALIFAHGNAELIDNNAGNMEPYRQMGISVLLVEYRGYGRSTGSPSQHAIADDLLQFHDWLLEQPEVDRSRLIYHGRSLGGGVLFTLAAKHPPAAMILESTFQSAKARFAAFGIPGFIVRDPFDNLTTIASLDCPILLFHGRYDNIIPHADSVVLQARAKRATLISYDCGHNDLPPDDNDYWDQIEAFLRAGSILRP